MYCSFVRVVSSRLTVQEQVKLDTFWNIPSILQGRYRSNANIEVVLSALFMLLRMKDCANV